MTALKYNVFDGCRNLVIYIPPNINAFFSHCLQDVKLAAVVGFDSAVSSVKSVLLPSALKADSSVMQHPLRANVETFFTDDYERYAVVFDAIGELNVIWVESLRRQSKIRKAGAWNKALIVQESEIRNRVVELWNRIEPYDIYDEDEETFMFLIATDITNQGNRLVIMPSYQNQPEETKLFKEILDSFSVNEPPRLPPSSSDARQVKRALMANLRL